MTSETNISTKQKINEGYANQLIISRSVNFVNKQNQFMKLPNTALPKKFEVTIFLIDYSSKIEKDTNLININTIFISFFQNYENCKIKKIKKTIEGDIKQLGYVITEDDYLLQIIDAFESFLNGEEKSIIFLFYWEGYSLRDLINKILINNEKQFEQQINRSLLKKLDDYKVTLISLEYSDKIRSKQKYSKFLQSFVFEIGSDKGDNSQTNQYFFHINVEKVAGELAILYKFFVKQKIREFQPDIIVLTFEVNSHFNVESFYLQKFIAQLQKQSQNKLLIIPVLADDQNNSLVINKYFRLAACSVYGCGSEQQKRRKLNSLNEMTVDIYDRYSKLFGTNNGKKKSFMKLQQTVLKLKNLEASPKKSQGKLKSNQLCIIINSDIQNQYRVKLVEVFYKNEDKNEPIYIDQETNYQMFYSSEFVTLFVQYDKNLYWKTIQLSQITDSYILEDLKGFEYRQFASYFLTDRLLFQFFGFKDNNFLNTIIEYSLDNSRIKRVFIVAEEDIKKYSLKPIINFTVLQHKSGFYSLVGGSIKDSKEYVGSFMVQLLYQEQKAKIARYNDKRLNNQGNFFRSIKEFENPLILSDQKGKFLFFETETKYYNLPLDPKMQLITFMPGNGAKHIIENLEVENIHQFQEKCYLFKSNQMNCRVSQINKYNKKYTQFDILVQERVLESLRFQKEEFIGINYINTFGKVPLYKTYHYKILVDNQAATIESTIYSSIMKDFIRESRLQQKCLYQHYLDELHDQEIFHYDIQLHQYLLYFTQNETKVSRLFIFEYQAANKSSYDDFDESILVNTQNEIIWIVRKKYNDDDTEDLILYDSDWINLQDVKNAEEGTTTKISITERFTIKNIECGTQIIGMEINDQQNSLLIVTTTTIYQFSLEELLKGKWDNVLKFLPNSWNKVKPPCQIQQEQKINIDYNITQPAIVKCIDKGDTLFFYLYGDAISIDQHNQYEVKFKCFRWDKQRMQESIEKIKFTSESNVVMAKLCNIEVEQQYMALGIVLQLEDNTIIRMCHNTTSKKQNFETMSPLLGTRVLHNAGHNKHQTLSYTKEKQVII